MINTRFRFKFQILDLDNISVIWASRRFQMKKVELVDLDQIIYNFHIKFISMRVKTKKLRFFWKWIGPYRRPKRRRGLLWYPDTGAIAVGYCSPPNHPTSVSNGGSSLPPLKQRWWYSFAKYCEDVYFCKFVKNIKIKIRSQKTSYSHLLWFVLTSL
jgi:hypothetical protein